MKFGKKVLYAMGEKNITPEELANRSGFSASYIYSITNGNRQNPPLETIKKLAESLGVEPGYLIDQKTIGLDPLVEFVTPAQIATRLQVAERTVLRLLASGELMGIKLGRVWRIREKDFEEFLKQRQNIKVEK